MLEDWNETPNNVKSQFERGGCEIFLNKCPTKSTRILRDRKRTNRTIDFAISNTDGIILSQKCRRNWCISDHLPVEVKINMKYNFSNLRDNGYLIKSY